MMKQQLIVFMIFAALRTTAFSQSIVYVKSDAAGSNDGTSWTNAYTDLQSALSSTTADDTIWVAAGTYKPSVPGGNWATFQMVKQVDMYGGFNGTETLLSQRDYTTNQTILSGDIDTIGDITDNVNHVVSGIDSTRIDGFVIQDGYAESLQYGGGMYNYTAGNDIENLNIVNCTFKNNYAKDRGMAIYNENVKGLVISNCIFEYNQTTNNADGAAIYSRSSNYAIQNCNFNHNTAGKSGGAIYNYYSQASISNSEFSANTCNENGGAIIDYLSTSKFFNNIFSYNDANNYGGGIYSFVPVNSHDTIINCTFYLNYGKTKGGAIVDYDDPSVVTNSIFMNNSSDEPLQIEKTFYNVTGTYSAIVNYSCVYFNTYTGTGNIIEDPEFVDNNSDWHIKPGSPCIDAGNGDVALATDLDNNLRHDDFSKVNTGSGTPDYTDMGAYEFQGNSPLNGTYTIGTSGDFPAFTQAVDSLISLGVNGPVTFNVETGTYNEQVTLPGVDGESSVNTITFQSATGDSTDVILTYAANSTNNYTVKLNGTDFVTFKNITLQATDNTYARIVELTGGACQNNFKNNRFIGVNATSELIYSYNTTNQTSEIDTNNVIAYNSFTNGQTAISLTTNLYHLSTQTNIAIHNNEFINQTDKAIYLDYYSHSSIKNNSFSSNTSSTGIYIDEFSAGDTISNNNIQLNSGGIGININNCYRTSNDTSLVFNNFIYLNTTNTDIGINIYSTYTALKILYNTVNITGDNTDSYSIKKDGYVSSQKTPVILNNIFSNKANGQAAYFNYPVNSDYNCFYSTGQYLINSNSLENWQNNFHHDTLSIEARPYFIADNNWDVQNLKLNGSGTTVTGVNTDIEGEARDAQNPDMGCNEFTPATSPMHGTYTIGGSGPDFNNVSEAVDSLVLKGVDGPVIFNIAQGTYNEQISIHEITGASAANTITFQSASGDSTDVVLNYKPTEDYKKYTIQLNGADYLTFKQISIASDTAIGTPVEIFREACFNSFENSKIYFSDNNSTSTLIYFGSSDNAINYTDSNNVFRNCYFDKGKYAINVYYYANPKNTNITGNIFNNMLDLHRGSNYYIYKNSFNITATANYTEAVLSVNNSVFANNMIYIDNSDNYADCYGIYSYGSNNEIYYNSINIKGSGTPVKADDNATIKNNILIADNSGCLSVGTNGSDIDYNIYYKSSKYNLINNYTLDDWQQNTGFDTHSIYKNVAFISETDLHTNDPWASNRGTAISGITEDIDGNTRNTPPDIGACEFDGQMPLSGNYTIGSGGNFATFSKAVDSLNFCGVDSFVTFKVLDGTYTEQFRLADSLIYRLPDTARIAIESQSGDNSTVILQYDAGAANNYVVYLDSVSNVNINNISIKALNQTNSIAVLMKECYKDTINGNIIEGNGQTMPVIYSSAPAGNENVIANNIINNGKIGILLNNNTTNLSEHNYIIDNTFNNQYSGGIFAKYQKFAHIERNKIYKTTAIEDTSWVGIGLISCEGSYSERALTANNMISFNATDKSAGIHLFASNYQNIYYNSVNIFGNTAESRAFNQESGGSYNDLKNNIFYNTAGGLVYYTTDLGTFGSDYNDIYTNGDNFAYNTNFISDKQSWISTTGKDANSVSEEPLFVSDTDLHIGQILLVGKGIPVNEVPEDIDGETRDTLHTTIGADKITINCSGPLSGNYTIGQAGDYSTFNDAVNTMILCGLAGSVNFNVETGTYNEQIALPAYLPGYTENDSITFQSQTGDSTDVVLQYDADSLHNYIVKVSGTKNVTFQNLTFKALDTTFARLIVLSGLVDNINIRHNKFIGVQTLSDDNKTACIYSGNLNDTDTMLINIGHNYFENGSSGIDFNFGSSDVKIDLYITGNTVTNQRYAGICLHGITYGVQINDNLIHSTYNPQYGIVVMYINDTTRIFSNKIYAQTNRSYTAIESNSNPSLVFNNFISIEAINNPDANIEAYYSIWPSRLYHNSILCYGSNSGSYFSCIEAGATDFIIKNNNLVSLSGKPVFSGYQLNNVVSDYNNLYTTNWITSSIHSLQDWQSQTGQDLHSVSFLPDFVSNTDLHTHSALLNGKGTPLAEVATDIDGEPRNAIAPDIGADEFDNPVFVAGNDTVFCYFSGKNGQADAHIYDIGYGYDSYLWSTGSDSSSIPVDTTHTAPGDYDFVVTVTVGSDNYTDTVHILYDLPVAIDQTEFCRWNTPVTITANPGFVYYDWGTGDDTIQSITKDCYGCGFTLNVTDQYGCISKRENITIHGAGDNYPANLNLQDTVKLCTNHSMELAGNQFTGTNVYGLYSFMWNTGDTIQSLTLDGSAFTPGIYPFAVSVYLVNDTLCVSHDTVEVYVDPCTGVGDLQAAEIVIYPNPSTGRVFVNFKNPVREVTIAVYNILGKMVWQSGQTGPVPLQKEIDLSGVSRGIYFLRIRADNRVYQQKLIIK